MPVELADRIRALEDRAAIVDLAVRYCLSIDDGDYDALLELYTDDATLGEIVGKQNVVAALQSARGAYGRTIHVPEAHRITLDEADRDHASGIVLSHAELDIDHRTVRCYIRYLDRYERGADGAWRFADRDLRVAYALPVEETADSMTSPTPVRWPGAEPAAADAF